MIIKQTEEMTLPERLAAENSNNQYLAALAYVSVGTIFPYAGTTAPDTFKICDGSTLKVEEYPELFDVIGYTFGGSGESFKLPDLRGKTLVGVSSDDTNFDSVGKTGGAATHTLKESEMPSHSHIENFYGSANGNTTMLGGNSYLIAVTGYLYSETNVANKVYGTLGRTTNAGENQPHNNMPPYLVCNYIIKVTNSVMKDDFRFPIDQKFDPQSENAQSGKAIAVEFHKKADRNKILDYIIYNIENGQVRITDCDTTLSGIHSIPDFIDGYPVAEIGSDAFKGCAELISIVLPNSVSDIGSCAFDRCSKLTSITLPTNLKTLSGDVFDGCEELKSIHIPNSVINIDGGESGAFRYSGISDVFYEGSKEQWKSICDGLEESEGITIHYHQRPATVDYVNSKLGNIETLLGGI